MKRTAVDDLHKRWMKNPKYRREYEALEEEFSRAAAVIEAQARAGLTQEQVAQRMKTFAPNLFPLGVDYDRLDTAWPATMNSFGSTRSG